MDDQEVARVQNPYPAARPQEGAVALIESQRAVAEALAAMQIARQMPRDARRAMDLIISDCSMLELAEDATYDYARGGTDITGPSIRLLETICRRWGNMECGVKELGRREEYSEVMTYAVDLESGFKDTKVFQVRHWRDKKSGKGYIVTDERDIYEIVANYAARRKRACMEAVIPPDVKDAAIRQCELTLKAKIEITPDSIKGMLEKFEPYGITQELIEKRIQRRVSAITAGHFISLRKIYNSLKERMSEPADWFDIGAQDAKEEQQKGGGNQTDRVAAELAAKRKKEAEPAREAEPKAKVKEPDRRADPETGEITNESLRNAIAAAGAQETLTGVMLDMMKLPAGPERDETIRQWNARVMVLKGGAAPAPAGAQKQAKLDGTPKIKADLIARMNKAKTVDALAEVAGEITLYVWDAQDRKDLDGRYRQCKEDIEL